MAALLDHPQSPPRKRPRLSLKLIRKDQQSSVGSTVPTVKEEPVEITEAETSQSGASSSIYPMYPEPSLPQTSACIPSEYVVTVAPYTGLHNLGNTCYLNSVLQVLRYCPSFTDCLERLSDVASSVLKGREGEEPSEEEDERSRRNRTEFVGQLKLVHKLNKLFNTMSEKEQSYLERMMPSGQELAMYPEDILEAIRDLNPMFKGYLQHDAQELLCCILSNVQEACQRLWELQETPKGGEDPALKNSLTSDPPSTSESSMKAVRRLDMGGPSDGAGEGGAAEDNLDCGRLRGGARPRNAKNLSHTKLECNGKHHQENGCSDQNGILSHGVHGGLGECKDKLCNTSMESGPLKSRKGIEDAKWHHGGISPSNDSVRRRGGKKTGLTNGTLSQKECGGMDLNGYPPEMNGGGDCGSSKKKRLWMGRFVTLQQSTLLSKFGILKKEKSEEHGSHQNDIDSYNSKAETVISGESEDAPVIKGTIASRNVTSNNSNGSEQSPDTKQKPAEVFAELEGLVSEEVVHAKQSTKAKAGTIDVNESKTVPPNSETLTDSGSADRQTDSVKLPMMPELDSNDQESAKLESTEVAAVSTVSHENEMKLVERLFQGTLVLQTRCLECEACSEKREDFQDVSVPVQSIPTFANEDDEEEQLQDANPKNLSLSWALSEFTSVERLTDDNKYYCEHCFHLTEAERSVLFGRLPGVLIIQLKRFSAFINCFSPGGSVSKVNDHLAIPLSLSLAKWCSSSCREKNAAFELCAVVAHSGSSSSSGHYIAYARVPHRDTGCATDLSYASCHHPQKQSWANFDDDRVQVLSDEDFESLLNPLPGNESAATPYLLLYRQTHQSAK